ncbi:NusG domain II-containing protein [Lactovum odontotermitis]
MKFLKELRLRPLDGVLLVVLVALAFLPIFLFANKGTAATEVQVKLHGKVIKTLDLSVNQKWTYESESGDVNKIQIKDKKVRVYEANCPDQIDVKAGWKSKNGETIVCLPHSLVVELTGGKTIQDGKTVDYQ